MEIGSKISALGLSMLAKNKRKDHTPSENEML